MTPRLLPALLLFGYAFLYLPIGYLVLFSFNDSRLVTAWSGFSLRWYAALWNDRPLLAAGLLSLRIAAASATLSLVLGTLAGFAMARFGRFRGRGLFAACLAAPLVMPDVIAGLALLLLFVALEQLIGWPAGRGALTIGIAQASISVAYVAVVVQARLTDAGRELEDAAADLYAPPWKVFALITLPLMAPALVSGWLLAFTLSLDDVVVASFTSGPGASTLPMVVFSSLRLGPTPEINALATLVVGFVALVLVSSLLMQRSRARHAIEPGPSLRYDSRSPATSPFQE
jgi:putrescine transport system permease protein